MANADRSAEQFRKMTETPIPKLILSLAAPTILSMLITSIYNLADTFFVGQISTSASGAVGIVSSLMAILQALGFMLGHGSGSIISRSLGSQNTDAATRFASTSFFTALVFGGIITAAGLLTLPDFMMLLGSTETILPHACAYARYILLAAPIMMSSLVMNNILRYEGKASFAMIGLVTGGLLNIALDPLFIFGLGMVVKGAAIATVLSQAVGAIWVIRFLTGPKTILKIRKEDMKLEGKIIMPVLALGISTFVMLSTESLLSISFSSSLARYGGDVAVGAMTVITSASQLCTMPISGICQGGQPVMSFNFGAGKKDRVKQAFRFQLTLCLSYTTIFWLLMMLVPGAVAGIFTSDASLIDYTTWAMRIYMAGIFSTGVQIACQQSFMALGQAKVSLLLACLRKLILLIPLIFILPHVVANPVFGVFLAEPVSDIIAAAVTATTFFLQFNKILDKGAGRV